MLKQLNMQTTLVCIYNTTSITSISNYANYGISFLRHGKNEKMLKSDEMNTIETKIYVIIAKKRSLFSEVK